jgi:hypothetical protein
MKEGRKERLRSIENLLRRCYGTAVTKPQDIQYAYMSKGEKMDLLRPFEHDISNDLRMMNAILDEEARDNMGAVLTRFRKAEGVDSDMIDQIASQETMEPGTFPVTEI